MTPRRSTSALRSSPTGWPSFSMQTTQSLAVFPKAVVCGLCAEPRTTLVWDLDLRARICPPCSVALGTAERAWRAVGVIPPA